MHWQPAGDEGVVERVAERRNLLFRQDEWRTKSFAANLDQVLILVAAEPEAGYVTDGPGVDRLGLLTGALETLVSVSLDELDESSIEAEILVARAEWVPPRGIGGLGETNLLPDRPWPNDETSA